MPKYTFWRNSVVAESFTVVAESEDLALDMVQDGHPSVITGPMEWIDWASDEYELESTEDELVIFLNSKYTMTQEEKDQIISAGSII